MENKEVVDASKMSKSLIGNWLSWGIIFGLLYSFIFPFLTNSMDSLFLKALIAMVLQGFIAIILWKISTQSSFKKMTISSDDVPVVMKKLLVFTIIICLLSCVYEIYKGNSYIDEAVKSNYQIQLQETFMSKLYTNDQMSEYNKQKEEAISSVKHKLHVYIVLLEAGLAVVYLGVLPLEKKEILKYVSNENDSIE